MNSQLILMDEAYGRDIARTLNLSVRGSLGVLVEAYRKQIINSDQLRLKFAELARGDDVWISKALLQRLENEVLEKKDQQV